LLTDTSILHSRQTNQKPADKPKLQGLDHIELYVGNCRQAAYFYKSAFGFTPVAFTGLETGSSDRMSIAMQQGDVRLVLTSPIQTTGGITEHLQIHGEGVKDIAFHVDDAEAAFDQAVRRGSVPVADPAKITDENGEAIKATVQGFGDIIHSFVQRNGFRGNFLPNFRDFSRHPYDTPAALIGIDHVAFSVELKELDECVNYYKEVFGFHESQRESVTTEYSGMNSKVVESENGKIKFPIVAPIPGKRRSQVEEYLSFHQGPGAQHIAFLTSDIVGAVGLLRAAGVEFLTTPRAYYEHLEERVGKLKEHWTVLRDLNILVDRDEWGHLLQIFTKPLQSRPTLFLELIERRQARGFGSGNIRALFEAIEREQAQRGTL
jgi:4-hydroxyphenylpyruvate dioxygenase